MIVADRSLHDIRNLFDLTGKIAFVTGGGSGLGFAVARGFAGFGARVAIADINGEAAKSSAEAIAKETGHDAMGFEVDVTRPEMVEKAHLQVRSSWGGVDILVNAAGINCRKPFLDLSLAEFEHVMATHVSGTFLCTKTIAPDMIAKRAGAIINFASIMAHVGWENVSAYSAAKGAIVQFTKVSALELAPHGVRVNALAPGIHDTPLTRQHSPETRRVLIESTPMGRFAMANEIIGPAVFLASAASSFVTGTSLITDGGWVAQ